MRLKFYFFITAHWDMSKLWLEKRPQKRIPAEYLYLMRDDAGESVRNIVSERLL
ncbi:MAG: hypothetical protein M0016_07860 [Deltaproteobacteria bacterium]|jgi:hypothetical protein|nr:hypothetical protein [Deltaproteobacteria bacterium]